MKINKRNPRHWAWLVLFGVNTVAALLLRLLSTKRGRPLVFLYGHKLNGNLKAIYDCHGGLADAGFDLRFLTMDPDYYKQLRAQNVRVLLAVAPGTIPEIARCACVVSDHGLHALELALHFSNIQFVDVWHGIPFKGFDRDDFKVQHHYLETWVTSDLLKQMYVSRFGFEPGRVRTLGYARTDLLVNREKTREEILAEIGLDLPPGPIVLIAPTWKQDQADRNIYPFGFEAEEFCSYLAEIAESANCIFLLRTHLNADVPVTAARGRVQFVPADRFPDTELLLLASDVLVSDWSSIVFDYLLLDWPTIFLDVPPPFAKGFSLDGSYRFGEVVGSEDQLKAGLLAALNAPETYRDRHGAKYREVRQAVYDGNADGQASARCVARLREIVTGQDVQGG